MLAENVGCLVRGLRRLAEKGSAEPWLLGLRCGLRLALAKQRLWCLAAAGLLSVLLAEAEAKLWCWLFGAFVFLCVLLSEERRGAVLYRLLTKQSVGLVARLGRFLSEV